MDINTSQSLFSNIFQRTKLQEAFEDEDGNREIVERVQSLSRILYIAEINSGATHDQIRRLLQLFLQQAASDPEEAETVLRGLMILQNNSLFHLVEAAPEIVTGLFAFLLTDEKKTLINIRIIGNMEDCPAPLFPRSLFKVLHVPGDYHVNVDDNQDIAIPCFEMFRDILKIGHGCPTNQDDRGALDAFLRELPTRFAGLLPPDEKLLRFARSPKVMSADDYLELMVTHMPLQLSEERAFPVVPRIRY